METQYQEKEGSVLVVDDNPKNLQVLGSFLTREGLELEFALDGSSAIEWTGKKQFDLILLDVMMPGMDGFEVCSILKQNAETSDIPVIFITARTDQESVLKGFEAGGVDYITKPFIPKELLARVRTQLNIRRSKAKILHYLQEIEARNKNIRDSMEYARYLQKAVLNSSFDKLGESPENFILIMPRDIVSGDFYWFHKTENEFIIAVMDCTGHGIPGALMSILGTTLLNEVVLYERICSPEKILDALKIKILRSLGAYNDDNKVRDGMEGAIIRYDFQTGTLDFAGSFRPLYYIKNNDLIKINADRVPVSYFEKKHNFSLQSLRIEKGDIVYLSTDGYQDQFGFRDGTRIMSRGFMNLLTEVHHLPMEEQKKKLFEYLNDWRGNLEQTDDILVAGIRF